jgi:hypothetical protein
LSKEKNTEPRRYNHYVPLKKFGIRLQDEWLRTYRDTNSIQLACERVNIKRSTYREAYATDKEFHDLKDAMDLKDIEVTVAALKSSALGYDKNVVREEQEWINPVPEIKSQDGKTIIQKGVPGHYKVVKRILSTQHFAPSPASLQFKLCNEDAEHYKQVNKIDFKGEVNATGTIDVIHGLDDNTLAELAKAVVRAKTTARK